MSVVLQQITDSARLRGRHGRRVVALAGFAACVSGLLAAYGLEFIGGMEPCPLCILQRVALFGLGVVFLASAIHAPGRLGGRIYGVLLVVAAGVGAGIAGRHLWLQSLPPDQVPACGPGLDFLLAAFPLQDALSLVLQGSGQCAEVEKVLGVTLPAWTLGAFLLLGLGGLWGHWRAERG